MNKHEAIKNLRIYGRDIVTVEFAQEIASAFDVDVREAKLVFSHDEGVDWGLHAQFHRGGEMVDISSLASVIAHKVAPDHKYEPCPYIGAGKSADWWTMTYCKVIEEAISDGA